MNYIVLDLEFNQPFNFKNGKQTELNSECPFEIIQIGAVKIESSSFKEIDRFNFMIKPQIYNRIHPFVEKITGITLEQIKDCPSFADAYEAFVAFIGEEEGILCTWGIDDIKSLFRNILYYKLDSTLISHKFINIQGFATSYLNYEPGKTIGLKNAVLTLNVPIETDFHNALNDADYTAKIFKIVHPEQITPNVFHISDLYKKKDPKKILNTRALISHFQSFAARELTDEEINMLKAAYKLGRNQTFDVSSDKLKTLKRRK